MIKGFAHKGLERFFTTGSKKGIQPHHEERLRKQLAVLDHARKVEDLGVPGWKLHPLKGDMDGHWSITVNGNWRITFRFEGIDAYVVDYKDYH
jgi:toxin HigB-1